MTLEEQDKKNDVLQKYVWDASALVTLINSDEKFHYQCYGFFQDNKSNIHIFPAIAWMEYQATQSRKERAGKKAYRDMYLLDEKNIVYNINQNLISQIHSNELHLKFNLRGMDLIYASISFLENAPLITLDNDFKAVADCIQLIYPNSF